MFIVSVAFIYLFFTHSFIYLFIFFFSGGGGGGGQGNKFRSHNKVMIIASFNKTAEISQSTSTFLKIEAIQGTRSNVFTKSREVNKMQGRV